MLINGNCLCWEGKQCFGFPIWFILNAFHTTLKVIKLMLCSVWVQSGNKQTHEKYFFVSGPLLWPGHNKLVSEVGFPVKFWGLSWIGKTDNSSGEDGTGVWCPQRGCVGYVAGAPGREESASSLWTARGSDHLVSLPLKLLDWETLEETFQNVRRGPGSRCC